MRPERRFERRNGNGRLRCRGRSKLKTDPSKINLSRGKNGLDNGVHFTRQRVRPHSPSGASMSFTVIADVTKAYPNTIQRALDAVQSFCSTSAVSSANITLVGRPDHVSVHHEFPPPS